MGDKQFSGRSEQGPPSGARLRELEQINRRLGAVDPEDPAAAVQANLAWHQTLVADCGNARLRGLLTNLRHQVYRYEISFFSPGEERLRTSVHLHRAILEALNADDTALACERLTEHWMTDLEELAPA